jgi:PPOX class probable F420-dependent enzyme
MPDDRIVPPVKKVGRVMAAPVPSKQINAFLSTFSLRDAILAVNRPKGGPQLTPVWFIWDGEVFWLSIRIHSAKYRYMQRDQDISVLVNEPESARYVLAYGRAEFLDENLRAHPVLRSMLEKYGVSKEEMEEGLDELSRPERVLVRLCPEKMLTRLG